MGALIALAALAVAAACLREALLGGMPDMVPEPAVPDIPADPALAGVERMGGRDFEAFCHDLLARHGYSEITTVSVPGASGADITARKDGEKWAFRCRRPPETVDRDTVWEALRAAGRCRCSRCAVLSTGGFGWRARRFAEGSCVRLIGRDELKRMMDEAGMAA